MKRFLQVFAVTLVFCLLFAFFGGIYLFDFSSNIFTAITACAFLLALILYGFLAQSDRIDALEKRLAALEQQSRDPQ